MTVDPKALAPDYEAEVYYTWAALEREQGDYPKAQQHAEAGLALAKRPSSVRNGLFMVASVMAHSGDPHVAIDWFEEALAHPYKGQARYGLSRYAAFLNTQGKTDRAATVAKLMTELDPESQLALPG